MFIRYGSIVAAERTTVTEWRKAIVAANIHNDPEKIEALAEFDVDKESFLYVRARAVSSGEHYGPNDNGDFFPEAELEKFHKTFVRRGVYVNHKSDDPAGAIGIILDAVWHGDKRKYVECLLAIDRSEPIAKKIESGIAHSWSMGALVRECECNVCHKTATTEAEYCDCLRTAMGKSWNGKRVYAINRGINFYELSNVTVPADPQAYTLQVLASGQEDSRIPAKLAKLYDAYTTPASSAKTEQTEAVREVRGKLGQQEPSPQTDRQILGTVRHRLKVATAPLLPRGDEKMRQRVKSTLDVGSARAEQKNDKIAETIPLEGIKVNNFTIRYLPGASLKECYFVARKGEMQAMTTAAALLDPSMTKKIEAAEKAELIKDDSKPSPDHEDHVNFEGAQPKEKVNSLSANPAKEMKDDAKPSPDNRHELGKDPIQPSDVVKKFAQVAGAKNVTFKMGENGSFTAYLTGGAIARLAGAWGVQLKMVRQAKIAGEPQEFAREEARGDGNGPRDFKGSAGSHGFAKEDKAKDMAKASGGSIGGEQKAYYTQYSTKDLAQGGGDQWAKKVNELTRVANKLDAENKALRAENDILKKSIEAAKQAAVEKDKSRVIAALVDYMEKVGAVRADQNEVLDLHSQGLTREEAEVKAYANTVDRKKAELKALDLKALQTMLSNLSDLAPQIRATAAKKDKDLQLPRVGRDERTMDDADILASNWE